MGLYTVITNYPAILHQSNMLKLFAAFQVNIAIKVVSFINFYKPPSILFQFIFNLMACGKGNGNQPIEDFIVHSPAPVDMAAKMSAIYNELSFKVKNQTC